MLSKQYGHIGVYKFKYIHMYTYIHTKYMCTYIYIYIYICTYIIYFLICQIHVRYANILHITMQIIRVNYKLCMTPKEYTPNGSSSRTRVVG